MDLSSPTTDDPTSVSGSDSASFLESDDTSYSDTTSLDPHWRPEGINSEDEGHSDVVVIGAAIGSVVAVFLVGGIWWFWWRRRKQQRRHSARKVIDDAGEAPPVQEHNGNVSQTPATTPRANPNVGPLPFSSFVYSQFSGTFRATYIRPIQLRHSLSGISGRMLSTPLLIQNSLHRTAQKRLGRVERLRTAKSRRVPLRAALSERGFC